MNLRKTLATLVLFTISTSVLADRPNTQELASDQRDMAPQQQSAPYELKPTTPIGLSNGIYLESYLGYGYVDAREDANNRNGLSAGVALGYRITDNWAVDAGYTRMPKPNVSTYYLYTSLKFIVPFHVKWDVFGKIGPAFVWGSNFSDKESSCEVALYAGFGATYWVRENLGFVLQSALTSSHNNVPYTFNFTGGLNYYF